MHGDRVSDTFAGQFALMGTMNPYVDSQDYLERVYAGVLGKIIGVYLGRPIENWTYDRILSEFGEVDYYIHEKRGRPLVVTDDDISGTFTFFRALEDNGYDPDLTPAQIGETWLNYIIEKTTILWWGGFGNSTEHTAFLRLKRGFPAPQSGSSKLNGAVLSEQIGAQIFIEGWGFINPGDPAAAASFARRAASVSHDGEAVHAAAVIASLVAQAFVEKDIDRLLDTAVAQIPEDSVIYRLIADVRQWHSAEPDWRKNREKLEERYGYDRFLGPVHVVPNHGLIILALLHGEGDFQRSLSIVNTCGWDTDCNSGNLGSILGVRNGLEGIDDGPDWRGPVADRLYLPSADAGRSISDAGRETYAIVNAARALRGLGSIHAKEGARFHFELPGSVQGFRLENTPETVGVATLRNVPGHSRLGTRSLAISFRRLAQGRAARLLTSTFVPPEAIDWTTGYVLISSPTIYSGQVLTAEVSADPDNATAVQCRPYISVYNEDDALARITGAEQHLRPGERFSIGWKIPTTNGYPIAEVGIELTSRQSTEGVVYLDSLDWSGSPDISLPPVSGRMWGRAWAKAIDRFTFVRDGYSMLAQDEGVGLLMHGTREWKDYRFSANLTPSLVTQFGICARVQGLRRYYAFTIGSDGMARITRHRDGIAVLASVPFEVELNRAYEFMIETSGNVIRCWLNGARVFEITDPAPLSDGGIAMLVEEGCVAAKDIRVGPLPGATVA